VTRRRRSVPSRLAGAAPHHVYLVPGFFGFANLGDLAYFGHVRDALAAALAARGLAGEIHVVRTLPTASLRRRAVRLAETVAGTAGEAGPIHLIGHSSGGLDARLFAAPGVALGTDLPVERLAARVASLVTVATPHHGTPVASFFASLLGQRVLRLLSLATMQLLRSGRMPLAVLFRLGNAFAHVDRLTGRRVALLDQVMTQLLGDFSAPRRRAVDRLFREMGEDQSLLVQLAPESMDLLNAVVHDRPGVRIGSVVTAARRPSVGTAMAAGLDPSSHATHAIYVALAGVAAAGPRGWSPPATAEQAAVLRRAYGAMPPPQANDGVVPTRAQVWGRVIRAVRADHLDVIGHFRGPHRDPPHYDWLATGSGFDAAAFAALWTAVADFAFGAADSASPAFPAIRPGDLAAAAGRGRRMRE